MKKTFVIQSETFARNYLNEVLNLLPPGGKLPGIRKMLRETGIGRIRLERLLRELQQQHRIEITPRSGCRKQNSSQDLQPILIHFSPVAISLAKEDFFGGIIQELKPLSVSGEIRILNFYNKSLVEMQQILSRENFSMAFVLGANSPEYVQMVRQYSKFVLSLLPRYSKKSADELRDSPDMTSIQLKYLFQHNYRRIACIHNANDDWSQTPVQMMRLMDYYRIMAENGCKIEPEWSFYYGENQQIFNKRMYKLVNCKCPPDAVIISGCALKYIYKFCQANGIEIGKDLALITADNIASELTPRPTAVTNTPSEIGKQARNLMQNILKGETVKEYTSLKIIIGETVHRNNSPKP